MSAVLLRVVVPVANLWIDPDRPRPVDAPATLDEPDTAHWLAALDAHPGDSDQGEGRLGLHRRLHTQLVFGEPAVLLQEHPTDPAWVKVAAPWQPSTLDPRGYPGWVRRAHVASDDGRWGAGTELPPGRPRTEATEAGSGSPLLDLTRAHIGLPYLWGGTTPEGLDCSGLVHWGMRRLGHVVPRDAHDQQRLSTPVALDDVHPGDLYFFAPPGGQHATHVGIVTTRGSMLHAPETGLGIVEEPLDDHRRATLTGAGRFPLTG